MVRSPTTQVIGSIMYDLWTTGTYPHVAVLAIIMVAVTMIGVAAAAAIGGSDIVRRR
jgi:iron(III) transport system permease protein